MTATPDPSPPSPSPLPQPPLPRPASAPFRGARKWLPAAVFLFGAAWLCCFVMLLFDYSLLINRRVVLLPIELAFLGAAGWSLGSLWSPRPWRRTVAAGALAAWFVFGLWLGMGPLSVLDSGPLPIWIPALTWESTVWLVGAATAAAVVLAVQSAHTGQSRVAASPAGAEWQAPVAQPRLPKPWLCDSRGWRLFLRVTAPVAILGHGAGWLYLDYVSRDTGTLLAPSFWWLAAWSGLWGCISCLPWRAGRLAGTGVAVGTCTLFGLWWLSLTFGWKSSMALDDRLQLLLALAVACGSLVAALGLMALMRWEFVRRPAAVAAARAVGSDAEDGVEAHAEGWDTGAQNQP